MKEVVTHSWYKWEGTDLLLTVYVQPRARHDEIVGPHGNALKIRITAVPREGQANNYMLHFLGKIFDVPATRVILVNGASGRSKRVRIIAPLTVPTNLQEWIDGVP